MEVLSCQTNVEVRTISAQYLPVSLHVDLKTFPRPAETEYDLICLWYDVIYQNHRDTKFAEQVFDIQIN
jgi:hypothetical protein